MKRLLVIFLFAAPVLAGEHDFTFYHPSIPKPKVVEAIPPDPQTHTFPALDTNNAFTGNNTHSGAETFFNLNDILWVGPGAGSYNTVAAAVTAAGSVNKTIIALRSTFTGTCPASTLSTTNPNITIWDFSGLCNPSTPTSSYLGTTYNFTDGNVYSGMRSQFGPSAFGGTNKAIVQNYFQTSPINFAAGVGGGTTIDGISAEVNFFGTFSGTLTTAQPAEHDWTVASTGGTISQITGGLFYGNTAAASTTAITNAYGIIGGGCNSILGVVPTNCYGGFFRDQAGKGSTRNYSVSNGGLSLYQFSGVSNKGGFDCEDATATARPCFFVDSSSRLNIQSLNSIGTFFLDNTGANQMLLTGAGVAFINDWKLAETTSIPGAASNDVCRGDSTFHGIVCNFNNAGPIPLPKTVALTADWTCGTGGTVSSCTSATIIGSGGGVPLTFTLPLEAVSATLECDGVVGQATAATANQWNLLTATNGATNVTANYSMATAATAFAAGAVTDQASTTTTFQIAPSWTLGGTGTKMPFHIWAKIEGASVSGTVVSLQLVAPTVGDLVTIYRGSSCRAF